MTAAFVTAAADQRNKPKCDREFRLYPVFLFSTPEQRFLFFKIDTRRPIGFSVEGNDIFEEDVDRIFRSHIGRDIGVEALVCGKVERVDLPLSPYSRELRIRQARVIRQVDLTRMLGRYRLGLQSPTK